MIVDHCHMRDTESDIRTHDSDSNSSGPRKMNVFSNSRVSIEKVGVGDADMSTLGIVAVFIVELRISTCCIHVSVSVCFVDCKILYMWCVTLA